MKPHLGASAGFVFEVERGGKCELVFNACDALLLRYRMLGELWQQT